MYKPEYSSDNSGSGSNNVSSVALLASWMTLSIFVALPVLTILSCIRNVPPCSFVTFTDFLSDGPKATTYKRMPRGILSRWTKPSHRILASLNSKLWVLPNDFVMHAFRIY